MTEIKEGVATAGDQNGDESSYYFVFLNADVDSFPTKILPTKRTQNRDWGKKLSLRIVAAGSLSPYIVLMSHLDHHAPPNGGGGNRSLNWWLD